MTITVDFPASRIRVSSDQAALDVGALYAAIKDAQDSETGVMYGPIAAGAGRFDLGGGRTSGLVVRLNAPWQVEFLGSGQRTVDGGTLVGGAGGQPVASTPGTQVILNRPADAFGVATSGSIGPTASEIAEAVWAFTPREITGGVSSGGGISPEQYDALLTEIRSRSTLSLSELRAAESSGAAVVTEVLTADVQTSTPLTGG